MPINKKIEYMRKLGLCYFSMLFSVLKTNGQATKLITRKLEGLQPQALFY